MTAPNRQNISPKAVELIRQIYRYNGVGCCWHVVLDDGNWDCIDFCRKYARKEGECETHGACQALADLDVTGSILSRAMDVIRREMREQTR